MNRLRLTRWQRLRLQRQLNATQDARVYRRTAAILAYDRGESIARIACLLGVTRPSVYNWIDAYAPAHDPGSLRDEGRSGRPSLWTEDLRALLQTAFAQTPEARGYFAVNWTAPLLQEQIEHCTGQRRSDDTIRRALGRLGYTWKRSRYVLDPDPERERKTAAPSPGQENPGVVAAQRLWG